MFAVGKLAENECSNQPIRFIPPNTAKFKFLCMQLLQFLCKGDYATYPFPAVVPIYLALQLHWEEKLKR